MVLKKRSGRNASFTSRAIAGASASSAMRISAGFGNWWILLQERGRGVVATRSLAMQSFASEGARATLYKATMA
jgi:hypothetical protein